MADKNLFLGRGPRDPQLSHDKKDFSFTNHLSATFGKIYPVYLQELNPNEHLIIRPRAVFDMMPLVFPLQSNIHMHLSFFTCAFRNLWKNYRDWDARIGNHRKPYIAQTSIFHSTGSLADYMGIPSYVNRPTNSWVSIGLNSTHTKGFFSTALQEPYHLIAISGDRTNSVSVIELDSLDEIFSTFQNQSGDRVYHLFDRIFLPFDDSNPIFRFHLVSSSSLTDEQKQGTFDLSFIVSIPHEDNPLSNPNRSYYLLEPQTFSYSAATASNLPPNKFTNSSDHVVSFNGSNSFTCHDLTFTARLGDRFIYSLNYFRQLGYQVRPVIINSLSSKLPFDNSLLLRSTNFMVIQALSPAVQNNDSGEADLPKDSTKYNVSYYGLQGDFTYRAANSNNEQPSTYSPFVMTNNVDEPDLPLDVLPFRMYQFIYNLYFRNSFVDPFIKDGQPTYNEFLTNDGDGADSTTPLDFNYALYEPDIFTTAQFTPMLGDAPLVGISRMPGAEDATFHFVDENGQSYTMRVETNGEGVLTGITEYPGNANETTIKNLNTLIQYGISINDFRSVNAYTKFLERMSLSNRDYKSYTKEFFGTNAPIGEEFPQYIGGLTELVNIYKLENQSSTTMPLGYFAGAGRVEGAFKKDEKPISCFSSERNFVMGLMWFSVTPVYGQKLDKMWTKSDPLDYYNPQFAAIGNQPIQNYQIAPLQATSKEQLYSTYGYQRPWYEYTMKMDECHGEFRSSMHNYLLQREFAEPPQLGSQMIHIDPMDLTNVFSYTQGSDKFYGSISYDVNYSSIVPDFIRPSIS